MLKNRISTRMIAFVTILLSIYLISCKPEFDDVIASPESRIGICSMLSPDSNAIIISKTHFTLDTLWNYLEIPDAIVKLYEDGNVINNLSRKKNNFWGINYFHADQKLKEGTTYTLEASAPGYPDVKAETSIPFGVTFLVKKVESLVEEHVMLTLEIDDPVMYNNYYSAAVLGTPIYPWQYNDSTTVNPQNDYTVVCDDPVVEFRVNYTYEFFFSDKLFNGKKYDIKVQSTFDTYCKIFIVRLYSLTHEFYEYHRLYDLYWNHDEFSEPTTMYSNIKGGFGIFGGYTYRDIEIQNPYYKPYNWE